MNSIQVLGALLVLIVSALLILSRVQSYIRHVAPIINQVALLALFPLKMTNLSQFSLSTINFILLFLATELNCVVMSTHGY